MEKNLTENYPTTSGASRRVTVRFLLVSAFVVICAACASSANSTTTSGTASASSSPAPVTTAPNGPLALRVPADEFPATPQPAEILSFGSPLAPFDTEVFGLLRDDGGIQVVDPTSGETLASDPRETFISGLGKDGALYIAEPLAPADLTRLWRFDANGLTSVDVSTSRFTAYHPDASTPTLVTSSSDGPILTRLTADGQIERRLLDKGESDGVELHLFGDTILATDNLSNLTRSVNFSNYWVLNDDLTVAKSFQVPGQRLRAFLLDEATVRVRTNEQQYDIDLETLQTVAVPTRMFGGEVVSVPFGDGMHVVHTNDSFQVTNQSGDVIAEQSVPDSTLELSAFKHPSQDLALISVATCFNRDGNQCEPGDSDGTDAGESVEAPPSFIELFQLDLETNALTRVELPAEATAPAALATESGWLAVSVIDGNTTIFTIDSAGAVEIVRELGEELELATATNVSPFGEDGILLNLRSSVLVVTGDETNEFSGWLINKREPFRPHDVPGDNFVQLG